jgi:hypothetical protein
LRWEVGRELKRWGERLEENLRGEVRD